MTKKPHMSTSVTELTLRDVEIYAVDWLNDGEYRQFSQATLSARRLHLDKLLWFLRQRECETCGTKEIRAFLAYFSRGHQDPGGRWGNPELTRAVKPSTVRTYYLTLQAFCNYLVRSHVLEASPMADLAPPLVRSDQIQPFTPEQVNALLEAARKTRHPRRDEAIVLLLLDTGGRVSEICALRVQDVDLQSRKCMVVGKGNKRRAIFFGGATNRALWAYFKEEDRAPDSPLFTADAGQKPGEGLTRSGIQQLIERLGHVAGLETVRCSPHTFRHTFAVEFLRAGGNVFALKELLGHTTLAIVNRYVALASADLENQHRQFSPADRLKRRK